MNLAFFFFLACEEGTKEWARIAGSSSPANRVGPAVTDHTEGGKGVRASQWTCLLDQICAQFQQNSLLV